MSFHQQAAVCKHDVVSCLYTHSFPFYVQILYFHTSMVASVTIVTNCNQLHTSCPKMHQYKIIIVLYILSVTIQQMSLQYKHHNVS